jgi:aspartyl-tRNA(Asn)/glutamyl-tRNA(Gln) amidotransferase subunit A
MNTVELWPSLSAIAAEVSSGNLSAVSQVKKALLRIADSNDTYNAVLQTIETRALKRAEEIDAAIARGESVGKLAGVPFLAKDNYLTFGSETTAGSNMLKGFKAPYQSTAIERLESEGAICVGKTNMDAFAHGGSTENSDFGVTKNPHDPTRVPGGSSGGSAAAVALHMVPFALGSDTGGSIRQPASFCGIVGLKPTYGLVSRSGVVAMASSTDCMGPMTITVEDAALVLDVIAADDPLDSTTIKREEGSYSEDDLDLSTVKIGVIKEWFDEGLHPAVKEKIEAAIETYKNAGAEIVPVSLPTLPASLAIYYVVMPAEVSSNLSRHDGQRYQFSSPTSENLHDSYVKSRTLGFGEEAKRRIMMGTHVLSSGYYDAYYKKAQTVRTKLINEFKNAFQEVDALIGPVAPTTAFKIGENSDPLKMYMQDMYSVGASLAGLPSISIPCGEIEGLPVGLQLITNQREDKKLLQLSRAYEAIK